MDMILKMCSVNAVISSTKQHKIVIIINTFLYWAIQAGLLTPLTFA